MCPTQATLFGRRLQVSAESQQTAIDCEGAVGSGEKTKNSGPSTSLPSKPACGRQARGKQGKRVAGKRKVAKKAVSGLPALHRRTARNGCATGRRAGLKPFACLRFFRTPEGVLPRIEIRGFPRQERHTG